MLQTAAKHAKIDSAFADFTPFEGSLLRYSEGRTLNVCSYNYWPDERMDQFCLKR